MTDQQPSQRTGQLRKMLLALDAMNCERELIDAAATLAARLEAQLDAVFVEDTGLYELADLPVTEEISLTSARSRKFSGAEVQRRVEVISLGARDFFQRTLLDRRIPGEFHMRRGHRDKAVLQEIASFDLLMLPPLSGSPLIRVQTHATPDCIYLLVANTSASQRAWALAEKLAESLQIGIQLREIRGEEPAATAVSNSKWLQGKQEFSRDTTLPEILRSVADRSRSLLIVAGDLSNGAALPELLTALSSLRCQVLLVN